MHSKTEDQPRWAELPRDITAAILHKLGAIEMLMTAQYVCKEWLSVCLDPTLWRSINTRIPRYLRRVRFDLIRFDYGKTCRDAVDRSKGQLIDINIDFLGTNELLLYISRSSTQLRHLQLRCCYTTSNGLIQAVKNFHLLEELHLYYIQIDAKAIEAIGKSCPLLKSFTLYKPHYYHYYHLRNVDDNEAQAIASNMPELRHLRLIGNRLTGKGVQTILDGCPHLESLNLRRCLNVILGREIGQTMDWKV